MPLLLPGANPVDSVMTQLWGRRAKLEGELTRVQFRSISKTSVTRTPPSLALLSSRAALSHQYTGFIGTQSRSNASTKVGKPCGRCGIVLLVALLLTLRPVMGIWSEEQPDHVIFRSKLCQPVSPANLIKMMGPYFDDKKMAPDMATAKQMFGSTGFDTEGFQGDDPSIDYEDDSNNAGEGRKVTSVDENVWVETKEGTVQSNAEMTRETLETDVMETRSWLPRRKVLNRHVDNKVLHNKQSRTGNSGHVNDDRGEGYKESTQAGSYTFMRRRRRGSQDDRNAQSQTTDDTLNDRGQNEDAGDNVYNKYDDSDDDSDIDAKDKTATNSIQLQLFLSGKDKKQRKKLKQKLRQSPVNLSKPPPWECKFSQRQRQMNKGVFPGWVLEGRCETDKCFYRLYNCNPIKYTLKLLQRDPTKCNPVPSVTNITIYEERWALVQKYVTVGCNCVSPIIKNTKPRSRRLD